MSRREHVLIVEDDASLSALIREELEDAGYRVKTAASVKATQDALHRHPPALVLSDLRLPDGDGMTLLQTARRLDPPPAFVMITAYGSVNTAVQALKAGADDFLTKPLDVDHLLVSIGRALEHHRARAQVRHFRSLLDESGFHGLLGHSPPMRTLFEQIRVVAEAQGPVLIVGESGVGKELVARALHAESARRDGPFLAVNCASIPGELLESEFFGHRAGAFTGAAGARRGLFDQADAGVLFLDEIGDMPAPLQAKLLRVLQDGRIRPVGGREDHQVDVRVVTATHRDLDALRWDGRFREDLYFRLEAFIIRVPPLRERGDDVDLLAGRFLQRYAAALGRDAPDISPAVLQRFGDYPFPGNVRELQNAVERAVTFCRDSELKLEHLPARMRRANAARADAEMLPEPLRAGSAPAPLADVTRRYVRHVLDQTQGNKRRAAALLGISRRTLYRYLDEE
ncbi:MAG TPA: sigma-54 dependent transcriptional regulator [Gammaproteobacteria bacterium]|nr:sigma-54 dependent transcriptional regulator [Gammaproteobacteria bacterium]